MPPGTSFLTYDLFTIKLSRFVEKKLFTENIKKSQGDLAQFPYESNLMASMVICIRH